MLNFRIYCFVFFFNERGGGGSVFCLSNNNSYDHQTWHTFSYKEHNGSIFFLDYNSLTKELFTFQLFHYYLCRNHRLMRRGRDNDGDKTEDTNARVERADKRLLCCCKKEW